MYALSAIVAFVLLLFEELASLQEKRIDGSLSSVELRPSARLLLLYFPTAQPIFGDIPLDTSMSQGKLSQSQTWEYFGFLLLPMFN